MLNKLIASTLFGLFVLSFVVLEQGNAAEMNSPQKSEVAAQQHVQSADSPQGIIDPLFKPGDAKAKVSENEEGIVDPMADQPSDVPTEAVDVKDTDHSSPGSMGNDSADNSSGR